MFLRKKKIDIELTNPLLADSPQDYSTPGSLLAWPIYNSVNDEKKDTFAGTQHYYSDLSEEEYESEEENIFEEEKISVSSVINDDRANEEEKRNHGLSTRVITNNPFSTEVQENSSKINQEQVQALEEKLLQAIQAIVDDNSQDLKKTETQTFKLQDLLFDDWIIYKIWPTVFFILLIIDIVEYQNNPNERYGNTLSDVLLGFDPLNLEKFGLEKSHYNIILNRLGSNTVSAFGQSFKYFAGSLFVIAGSLFGVLITTAINHYNKFQNKSLLSIQEAFKSKLWAKVSSLGALHLFAFYAYFRVPLVRKSFETKNYQKNKAACEAQNLHYDYSKAMQDYYCSLCVDWEDVQVNLADVSNPQKCLDALLSKKRDPALILEKFKELQNFPNDIQTLNLSMQDITYWNQSLVHLFDNIISKAINLQILDIQGRGEQLSQIHAAAIVKLVKDNKIPTLNIAGWRMGSEISFQFNLGLQNSSLINYNASNVMMGDGAIALESLFANSSIRSADISNNNIANIISYVMRGTVASKNLTALYLSSNPLQQPGFLTVALTINQTLLTVLHLNNVGENILPSTLRIFSENAGKLLELGLNYNAFVQAHLPSLAAFKKNNVKRFYYQGNDLSGPYARTFFTNLPSLEVLDIERTSLDSFGIPSLIKYIDEEKLTELNVSDNFFVTEDWINFISKVVNSTIHKISLRLSSVDNEALMIFSEALIATDTNLTSIDLTNNLFGDQSASFLLEVLATKQIEVLILSNNRISDVVSHAIAELISHDTLISLEISGTDMTGAGIARIVQAAVGKIFKILEAYSLNINSNESYLIAKSLLVSQYNLDDLLSSDASSDALAQLYHSKLATNIQNIGLSSNSNQSIDFSSLKVSAAISNTNLFFKPNNIGANLPRTSLNNSSNEFFNNGMITAFNSRDEVVQSLVASILIFYLILLIAKPAVAWAAKFFGPDNRSQPSQDENEEITSNTYRLNQ